MQKKTFIRKAVYRRCEPRFPGLTYLKRKSSFWIAAFSIAAFVAGNMIGQNGTYAFWASVLGNGDDTLITYSGSVPPLRFVPDYSCWAQYGGSVEQQHTYRELPEKCRIPLPIYDITLSSPGSAAAQTTYSVAYMGGYNSSLEGKGAHLGVDIRTPVGSPVNAVMNGIVTAVREDKGGFGYYIVIRHRAPDPQNTQSLIELDSIYAHLSAQTVTEGQMVSKGDQIGLSGMSGNATGPHLHFQIDRTAPFHPYWPFTSAEVRDAGITFTQAINTGFHKERGYQFTVNPMTYVQANYPAPGTVIAGNSSLPASISSPAVSSEDARARAERLHQQRVAQLIARRKVTDAAQAQALLQQRGVAEASTDTPIVSPPVSSAASAQPTLVKPANVDIQADDQFSEGTQKTITITLMDANGNTVVQPLLTSPLHVMTAFGDATFTPSDLTAANFHNGSATVRMTPSGRRAIVIQVWQYPATSKPMKYSGN